MRMHVTLSMFFYLMCCCLGTVVTFSCRMLFVCFLLLFFFIECLAIDECIVSTIFTWKFKIKRQRFHVAVLHWGWKKQEKKKQHQDHVLLSFHKECLYLWFSNEFFSSFCLFISFLFTKHQVHIFTWFNIYYSEHVFFGLLFQRVSMPNCLFSSF